MKTFSNFKFIIKFLSKIKVYITNITVCQYIKILGIDPSNIISMDHESYSGTLYLLAKKLIQHNFLCQAIEKFLVSYVSKINYLENFSQEQKIYITDLQISDTKLIACAGSGKTRSIIAKIKFMVEHNMVDKSEVFAITFSKHAATDFHQKIKTLFPDYGTFCELKNFSTIDSLAKSILCRVKSHKSENVEILSIAFRNFLKEITESDIELVTSIKKIKHLFIDEAQDLNEIQYEVLMLLKRHFKTIIHLIGDPNQNIYQFRRSSSSYLINFPAKIFNLTLNFRSTSEIIKFTESIKPVKTDQSISATGKTGSKVTILSDSTNVVHAFILTFIKNYSQTADISNIAIICPTRGIGLFDSVGLSVMFNLLKNANILFNQLYDESGSTSERKKVLCKTPGFINLITYHGTKGLEFDVVFVMDFYQHLFNIKPTNSEHREAQYLLYVATSRAISQMFICTYTNVHDGYLNHWITSVPATDYVYKNKMKIPHLTYRAEENKKYINGITEIIAEMSDDQIDAIHDMLDIFEDRKLFTKRIYKDFTTIDRGKDETLFGIFCEELFYLQYYLDRHLQPKKFRMIEMLIDYNFTVIENEIEFNILKKTVIQPKLTWAVYDQTKTKMSEVTCQLIEKYLSRTTEMTDHVICTTEFVNTINANAADIKKTYARYLDSGSYQYNYEKILIDFFYLNVVQYAYDINHYYYINNHGKEKYHLLENGAELFTYITRFVSLSYYVKKIDPKINIKYPKLNLIGEIDFIERFGDSETIVEIKCVKEISIKFYIQLLLYSFCYYNKKDLEIISPKLYRNRFKIINLLTGLEHNVIIQISPSNMFTLFTILAETGNLHFTNLNLVYDLETTDKIEIIKPTKIKPVIDRSIIHSKGLMFYGKILPKITEIAIKDYDTGMVIINTLVNPQCKIKRIVQEITNITPSMIKNKPTIDDIKEAMRLKTKRFTNCTMMAHNGNRFDDIILTYENLIDPQCITFLDTLSIIPIHFPSDLKLESKKLGDIYFKLFKKEFSAHRAMADVNALIMIMKKLKIQF